MEISKNTCINLFVLTILSNVVLAILLVATHLNWSAEPRLLTLNPEILSLNYSESLHPHFSRQASKNLRIETKGELVLLKKGEQWLELPKWEQVLLQNHFNTLHSTEKPTTTVATHSSTTTPSTTSKPAPKTKPPSTTTHTQDRPSLMITFTSSTTKAVSGERPPPKPRLNAKGSPANSKNQTSDQSQKDFSEECGHLPAIATHISPTGFAPGVYRMLEEKSLSKTVHPTTVTKKILRKGAFVHVVQVRHHKNRVRGMTKQGLWLTLQRASNGTDKTYVKQIKLHIIAVADVLTAKTSDFEKNRYSGDAKGKSACYLRANVQNYTGSPLNLYIGIYDDPKWGKVYQMKNINETFPNEDLVLFMDAYDTLITASSEEIIMAFLKWKQKMRIKNRDIVLFQGSDQYCYPFEQWHWNENVTYHIFGDHITGPQVCQWFRDKNRGRDPALNAGLYIGTARAVSDLMSVVWELRNEDNNGDQGMTQLATWFRKDMVWVDSNSSVLAWARRAMKNDPTMCHDNMKLVPPPVLHFTKGRVKKHLKMCREFFAEVHMKWKTIPQFLNREHT